MVVPQPVNLPAAVVTAASLALPPSDSPAGPAKGAKPTPLAVAYPLKEGVQKMSLLIDCYQRSALLCGPAMHYCLNVW